MALFYQIWRLSPTPPVYGIFQTSNNINYNNAGSFTARMVPFHMVLAALAAHLPPETPFSNAQ
jgi:hypothetical protein